MVGKKTQCAAIISSALNARAAVFSIIQDPLTMKQRTHEFSPYSFSHSVYTTTRLASQPHELIQCAYSTAAVTTPGALHSESNVLNIT